MGRQLLPIDRNCYSWSYCCSYGRLIFSSDAWNNVTFIAGEIKNPKRNIGLALFLGTLIVTIIYVTTNVMYTAVLPLNEIASAEKDRVAVAASKVFLEHWNCCDCINDHDLNIWL